MSTLLIKNARYLIVNPFHIIEDGAILIEGNRISAVDRTAELENVDADEVIVAGNKIVMPGLIDSHNHIGEAHQFDLFGYLDSPLTGIADALNRIVFPAWAWIPEEAAYDLEMLGLLNQLKVGTTAVQDSYLYPDEAGRAAVDSGLRVEVAPTLITSMKMPDSNGPEADLERTRRNIENWHGAGDGRITFRVHPSATYNCHRWFLEECVRIANEYNVGIATHIAESGDEAEKARAVWPQGEVRRAYEIGLMGPTSLFFHSIVLNDEEIRLYAETETSVAHNPPTNSLLGNCARVPALLAAGVNVGLGTDMPTHDMFSVMRSVSQQHAIMPREFRGLPPFAPFQMCTQGGARALNLQDDIGELTPGKKADLVMLDLEGNTRLFPLIPEVLLTFITINGSPGDVSDVMVDGRMLMRDRKVLHLDEKKIIERAQMWNDRFLEYYHAKKAAGEPLIEWIHEEFQPDPA